MKFYTRYDVERFLLSHYPQWDERWLDVDVYNDEIVITVKEDVPEKQIDDLLGKFGEWFSHRYDPESRELLLDYHERKMKVIIDADEFASRSSRVVPLFEALYQPEHDEKELPAEMPGVPVYAFHSFKGGVGRTLVLLAMARSFSKFKDKKNGKPYQQLLIVDGDLEAPGLTWLADGSDYGRTFDKNYDISYLDALALVHETDGQYDEVLQFIAGKLQERVLRFPVGDREVEHYFLPAFRDVSQLMAMPITPPHLVKMSGRTWIMGDFLSRLGFELKVDAVLIDLRAGISEFSAPLLFDPRIQKFYVTSTSFQSVRGMEHLLRQIYQKPLAEEYPRPIVIINQVSDELSKNTLDEITERLLAVYPGKKNQDDGNLLDQVADMDNIVYIPFASNLVHLEGLKAIDSKLNNTEMAQVMDHIVEMYQEKEDAANFQESRENFLQRLESFAEKMEFAEKNTVTDFLRTTSLKYLARKYRQQIPNAVIMGAKGSGKTFVYMQLARCGTWEKFVQETMKPEELPVSSTYIMPFLRPRNMEDHARAEIDKRLERLTEEVGIRCRPDLFNWLLDEIQQRLAQPNTGTEAYTLASEFHWKSFWKRLMLESTGLDFEKLEDLQEHLQKQNKRLVFVIDGLEDIFLNVSSSEPQKAAIRALIQGLLNEFRENPKTHIGMLIFIRRDLAMHSIEQNWGQFASLYKDYELHWNHEEALRLVSWIASQVDNRFALGDSVELERASQELLERKLHALWGIKLGKPDSKEAYTANWVLAALSDFKEQLQARDVVRFLKYAAKYSLEQKGSYSDRFLAPEAIRKAIEPCSQDKISDLKKEMPEIERIFDILTRDKEKRQLPFKAEDYNLTIRDIKHLEELGFMLETDDGYYLPEIIRRGLGFQIPVGARPKVLALLKAARRRR